MRGQGGCLLKHESKESDFGQAHSRLIVHPLFNDTISEISSLKVKLPSNPSDHEMDFNLYSFPQNGELVSKVEEIQRFQLDPQKGGKISSETSICLNAYWLGVK